MPHGSAFTRHGPKYSCISLNLPHAIDSRMLPGPCKKLIPFISSHDHPIINLVHFNLRLSDLISVNINGNKYNSWHQVFWFLFIKNLTLRLLLSVDNNITQDLCEGIALQLLRNISFTVWRMKILNHPDIGTVFPKIEISCTVCTIVANIASHHSL